MWTPKELPEIGRIHSQKGILWQFIIHTKVQIFKYSHRPCQWDPRISSALSLLAAKEAGDQAGQQAPTRHRKRYGQSTQELYSDPSALMAQELRQLLHSPPRKHWSPWERRISCYGSLLHGLVSFCVYSSVSSCISYMLGVKTYNYLKNHFSKDYNLVILYTSQYFESLITLGHTCRNTQGKWGRKMRGNYKTK